MGNTSKGRGTKGSKYWMQTVVNSELNTQLNNFLGTKVKWLSPLKSEDYVEYKLNQDSICKKIGIKKDEYSFWPTNQPQWDGIAISEDDKTLFLIEAKGHLDEMDSHLSANSQKSINLITKSMKEVFDKKYSGGDFEKWINGYYQLGNRLTFLEKLNEISTKTGKQVKLVLLNFVDDYTHKKTTEKQWISYDKKVFKEMTGKETTPKDVIVINFSVKRVNSLINPMTGETISCIPRVLSYGFTEEFNEKIKRNLPNGTELLCCESVSDLFAYKSFYNFVNPDALTNDEIKELLELYKDFDETEFAE